MEKQWHNMTVAERKEVIKKSKKERSPVERGVISPDSLKAGIFALMCQLKVVVEQYKDGRRIVMEDFEDLQERYEQMDAFIKEMGL